MDRAEGIDVTSVRFTVKVGEYTTAEGLEWLPDAAKVVLRVRDEGGEVTDHQYGYTCLEHACCWIAWKSASRAGCYGERGSSIFGSMVRR